MTPAQAFGTILRIRRIAASLSQEELAFDGDLTNVSVSELECGKTQPTLTTVLRLAAALGCSGAALMAETQAQLVAAGTFTNREAWPLRSGTRAE